MIESKDSRYAFYRIIGAPIPMERHFFAYGETDLVDLELEERQIEAYKKEFPHRDAYGNLQTDVHKVPIDIASYIQEGLSLDDISSYETLVEEERQEDSYNALSRDIPSRPSLEESSQKAISAIRHWQRIRSWIPFMEAIYLTGSPTFNLFADRHVARFIVVADIGRVRHVWRSMQRIVFFMKLFSGTPKYTYCCEIVCDRTTAHLTKLKRGYADVGFVYQLAHATQLYGCSESHPSPLYFHNRRLTDYLPEFPLKPSIRLGLDCTYGKGFLRTRGEKICSGLLGDGIESFLRVIGKLFLIGRTDRISTKHLIVKCNASRKKVMLQRKMSRAKIYSPDIAPWSRSLFDR